jgi:thiol-disulfide isomerase/thioredoxin
MKSCLISVVLICALGAFPLRAVPPAPDAPMKTLDGAPLPLESLKGSFLVLDFWASWCAPCRASFPFLDALQEKYRARGVRVVGLTLEDNEDAIYEFLRAVPVRFTIARDPSVDPLSATMISPGTPAASSATRAAAIHFPRVSASFKHGITTDTTRSSRVIAADYCRRRRDLSRAGFDFPVIRFAPIRTQFVRRLEEQPGSRERPSIH